MMSAIAIVGMAGRFPGARTVSEFWENLRHGVESIRDRSDEELLAAGATAEDLAKPAYVKRASILEGVALFDASFFGFSPRDASIPPAPHGGPLTPDATTQPSPPSPPPAPADSGSAPP